MKDIRRRFGCEDEVMATTVERKEAMPRKERRNRRRRRKRRSDRGKRRNKELGIMVRHFGTPQEIVEVEVFIEG